MNKLENKVKLIIYGINEDTLHIISSIKRIHDIVAISDGLRHEEYMYGYPFCIAYGIDNGIVKEKSIKVISSRDEFEKV